MRGWPVGIMLDLVKHVVGFRHGIVERKVPSLRNGHAPEQRSLIGLPLIEYVVQSVLKTWL